MKDIVTTLSSLLAAKKISSVELTKEYVSAIEQENPRLNAYVHKTFDVAFSHAQAADRLRSEGKAGPLCGIPMTLKDNISTEGILTTCGSKILDGYRPIYNATVWDKLLSQGAVLLGKTNMDEFAMGSTCETSCYGTALNPRDITRVPGGSSGGVASAVGGNIAAYGLGSDTGGSIRQPASFCGLVGLKPTYGAVSRYGLIAYGSSFDQIGPITTSVRDAATVFDGIVGGDKRDQTTESFPYTSTVSGLEKGVSGLRIGVADEYFEGINPEIKLAIDDALKVYESHGAQIVPIRFPELKLALPIYYIIACAEASSNLGRFDGIRFGHRTSSYGTVEEMICQTRGEGFGREVKRRIMLGTYALSSGYYDAYYKKACTLRRSIMQSFEDIFKQCDVLLAPTVPNTAFPLNYSGGNMIEMYLSDICTVPVNIAGLPSISVPCGLDSNNLPIGMQLIGNKFAEGAILSAAYAYEQARPIPGVKGGFTL